MGLGDPFERLSTVAATTRSLKAADEAAATDGLLRFADLLPQSIARVVQRGVNHQPLVNLVVTNLKGPDFPLYALGARMLQAIPVVPLGANLTLEVAVLSYDGTLTVSVTADPTSCPDAATFTDGFERALDALGARVTSALAS